MSLYVVALATELKKLMSMLEKEQVAEFLKAVPELKTME